MFPIIWQTEIFGLPITIHSFGTLIVLAFLVSAIYLRRRAARDLGLDKERTFNVAFALLFIGLAGARFLYALTHYDEFTQEGLKFLKIWEGGLILYGGMVAGLLWLAWYLPRHPDLKGWNLVDRLALGSGLALFIGRWASYLSGENYGVEAPGLPWAVRFPSAIGSAVPASLRNVDLHPAQIYHSLHGLILFVILLLYLRRKPWAGRATGLFLMLYAVGTALVEVWRGDWRYDPPNASAIIQDMVSWNQLLSIPVFFAGIAIFLIRRRPDSE